MINPKAVRIGNTVLYDGEDWQIKVIDEHHATLRANGLIVFTEWDNISGVPITPEWFESRGFELKTTGKQANSYSKSPFRINFMHSGRYKGKTFIVFANVLNFDANRVAFTYQIENLFFEFTGEELTETK